VFVTPRRRRRFEKGVARPIAARLRRFDPKAWPIAIIFLEQQSRAEATVAEITDVRMGSIATSYLPAERAGGWAVAVVASVPIVR
jgi:hypothetical protein